MVSFFEKTEHLFLKLFLLLIIQTLYMCYYEKNMLILQYLVNDVILAL